MGLAGLSRIDLLLGGAVGGGSEMKAQSSVSVKIRMYGSPGDSYTSRGQRSSAADSL